MTPEDDEVIIKVNRSVIEGYGMLGRWSPPVFLKFEDFRPGELLMIVYRPNEDMPFPPGDSRVV